MQTEKKLYYRYKLVSDYKIDSYCINNVTLTKTWTDFSDKKNEMNKFIRSKINPKGFVDFAIIDVMSNTYQHNSEELYNKVPVIYDPVVLYKLSRAELNEVCKVYGIDTAFKVNDFLVKEVIKAQQDVENLIKEMKKTKRENKKLRKIAEEIQHV